MGRSAALLGLLRLLCMLGLIFLLPLSAQATSCAPLRDTYILSCSSHQCDVLFRAREEKRAGACTVGLVVELVSADVQHALLSNLDGVQRPGLYEVGIFHRYYGKAPVSGAELAQAFNAEPQRRPPLMIKSLAADTNLTALREEWEEKAVRRRWQFAGYWALEYALLLAVIVLVYGTTKSFRRKLLGKEGGSLLRPVCLQLAVLVFATFGLLDSAPPMLFSIAAPILLVVLLYELLFSAYVGYASKFCRDGAAATEVE